MAGDVSQRRLETLLGHLKGHHHDPSVSLSPTSQTEGSSERESYACYSLSSVQHPILGSLLTILS